MKRFRFRWLVVSVFCFLVTSGRAELLIGQVAGLSGPIAASAKEALAGAKLYFDAVNSKGGVNGEKISLIVMDDQFDPRLSAPSAATLIKQKNVLAMFMNRGTEHVENILPLLEQYGVPLVAPTSGAMLLRKPSHRLIFNLRASFQREAEVIVAHLKLIGITRIAVVYVDDSFGQDVMQGVNRGFSTQNLQPVALIKSSREGGDILSVVGSLVQSNAQSVIWMGAAGVVSSGIKALRAAGSEVQVLTLSTNASSGFIKLLGQHARGVVVAQVFPSERSYAYAVIREARDMAKAAGVLEMSPMFLEGYVGAKLMTEALRRAGPQPTRQGLVKALDGMRRYDLGNLEISYSPDNHLGLDYVELSIIGPDGAFKR